MNYAARLIFAMTLRQVPWLYKNEEMDTEFSKYTCLGTCVYSQVLGKKDWNNFFKYFSNLCLGSFEEDLCEIQWWAGDLTWETGLEVLFDTIPGKAQTKVNFANPSEEPTKDQSKDAAKVQLGEPMNCIGVTYWSMDEGLQEQKWLTKARPSVSDSSWKLEPWHTLYSLQAAQAGECLLQAAKWSQPLSGSSADLCFFQAVGLVCLF